MTQLTIDLYGSTGKGLMQTYWLNARSMPEASLISTDTKISHLQFYVDKIAEKDSSRNENISESEHGLGDAERCEI